MVGDIDGVGCGGAGPAGVDFVGGAGGVGFGAADDGDAGAFAGEPGGDGMADAASGAGDDGGLVLESHRRAMLRRLRKFVR